MQNTKLFQQQVSYLKLLAGRPTIQEIQKIIHLRFLGLQKKPVPDTNGTIRAFLTGK
jgi:hypothetical protein